MEQNTLNEQNQTAANTLKQSKKRLYFGGIIFIVITIIGFLLSFHIVITPRNPLLIFAKEHLTFNNTFITENFLKTIFVEFTDDMKNASSVMEQNDIVKSFQQNPLNKKLREKQVFERESNLIDNILNRYQTNSNGNNKDYNPPSVEEYSEQTNKVIELTGKNVVYWNKSGTLYHLYDDCQYLHSNGSDEIFEGTVAQARALPRITKLCRSCENRAIK